MTYVLQFEKTDTLAAQMLVGATSATLTTGNFGSPSGTQILVIDYDVPAKAEVVKCTIAGSALTSVTRAVDGTSAVQHEIGANVQMAFVPSHYDRVATRTLGYSEVTASFTSTATPTVTDITSVASTVTVPTGGARIKITVYASYVKTSAVAGTSVIVYIREGSTTLSQTIIDEPVTGYACPITVFYTTTATAGAHTYKASISQSAAGTMTFGSAGATGPAFILVENIE